MARVKVEGVIDDLSSQIKQALEIMVNENINGANIDRNQLYRSFLRAMNRKCSTWERVKDQNIEKE